MLCSRISGCLVVLLPYENIMPKRCEDEVLYYNLSSLETKPS